MFGSLQGVLLILIGNMLLLLLVDVSTSFVLLDYPSNNRHLQTTTTTATTTTTSVHFGKSRNERTCNFAKGVDDENTGASGITTIGPNDKSSVIVCMDWECLLNDQRSFIKSYRIRHGIDAAFSTWPNELNSYKDYYHNDFSWLENKLTALSHVFCGSSSSLSFDGISSATVDYALATRMILEEQELDQDESTGKNGKYAKQFHPRTTSTFVSAASNDDQEQEGLQDTSEEAKPVTTKARRRPLTVGEISVNWNEFLRETLQMKYAVHRQDPIPILQSRIEELQQRQQQSPTAELDDKTTTKMIDTSILQLLQKSSIHSIYVMTSCTSDMDILQSLMKEEGVNTLANIHFWDSTSRRSVQTILDTCCPDDSHLLLIESSWNRLRKLVPLFGDTVPRVRTTTQSSTTITSGSTVVSPRRKLSLTLSDWTTLTSHPTHITEATMNPWTQTLSKDDFIHCIPRPPSFQ